MSSVEKIVSHLYPFVRSGVLSASASSSDDKPRQVLKCPAASAEHADVVIGYRSTETETVLFFDENIGFPQVLRETKGDEALESSLRLAGNCMKTPCPHWVGSCALGHTVALVNIKKSVTSTCSIIEDCRWRKENGPKVCGPCKDILNIPMKEALHGTMPGL